MNDKSKYWLLIPLLFVTGILFLADLAFGSVRIPMSEIVKVLGGDEYNSIFKEIIINFRMPKAISAVLAGSALAVGGLLMQTLFRNPLADPYILGVSSGAGLGVALTMMYAASIPAFLMTGGWGITFSAVVGAALILLLVLLVSYRLQHSASLLIVGIMFGTIASSIVSIIQNFSNPDALKLYILWTFGSLSAVTWDNLQLLTPIVFLGMGIAFMLHKKLDGFLLGENYAKGLGISINQTRLLIILSTGLLAGSITAFTGPIAFVGVAVPHIARGVFRTPAHKILLPASILLGASLLLICDIITQIPAYTLPVNTVSALFGAPVIIWIILKRRK